MSSRAEDTRLADSDCQLVKTATEGEKRLAIYLIPIIFTTLHGNSLLNFMSFFLPNNDHSPLPCHASTQRSQIDAILTLR